MRVKMGSEEPAPSTSKSTESVLSEDATLPGMESRQEETPTPAPDTPVELDSEVAPSEDSTVRRQKLDDIAKEALKLQPKGYTLDTATVSALIHGLVQNANPESR